MTSSTQSFLVRKVVHVNASQAEAFRVFVEQHGRWWPLQSYHIGAKPAENAVIEPRVGGRWFERAEDGSECDWGRVLVWDPPQRLVLQWSINHQWQFDPTLDTQVDIRFVRESAERTRLELEHRLLESYGDAASTMQGIFDSERGWQSILNAYVASF